MQSSEVPPSTRVPVRLLRYAFSLRCVEAGTARPTARERWQGRGQLQAPTGRVTIHKVQSGLEPCEHII